MIDANKIGLIFFLLLLVGCITAMALDRPKRNRRFRNLPPPSFKDDRDSIQSHRRMYGRK